MPAKVKTIKTMMQCGACGETFSGKKCSQCGNSEGNFELNAEGVPKDVAYASTAFGNAGSLLPVDAPFDPSFSMSQQLARDQEQELSDNLRQSFVIKSELKKLELEQALKQKQEQIEPQVRQDQQSQSQQQQDPSMFNPFQQNTMSPQAQFMNQFMKMGSEDRTEFLGQLSDADPAALNTLSSFFAQNQQGMSPMQQPNPYAQPPVNPYMQYPPPWMQQQQPEPQYEREDSMSMALAIVDKLHEYTNKNNNQGPSESETVIAALRQELTGLNDRISSLAVERSENESSAVAQRLGEIENYMYSSKPDNSLKTQIHGIKEMVGDLREIGFMDTPASNQTVDEQIRLTQAKHEITKDDRELELQSKQMDVDSKKKDMQKALVSTLFSRGLQKSLGDTGDKVESKEGVSYGLPSKRTPNSDYAVSKPSTVVGEVITDAGVVRETRVPVKKTTEE